MCEYDPREVSAMEGSWTGGKSQWVKAKFFTHLLSVHVTSQRLVALDTVRVASFPLGWGPFTKGVDPPLWKVTLRT